MSKKITVRFTPEEYQALQRIMLSNVRGDMTQSEIIRELVKREAERRFKLSLPSPWGEMRNGRPKTYQGDDPSDKPDRPT